MCGICGTAGFADQRLLERMVAIMDHRGPDDRGVRVSREANVGLGNCRLSIIDLSPAGHMPMSNEDGTVWITQNGEIYNFQELRNELAGLGHRFRSQSDTEVLVHGYEEWGEQLLGRLNGMFAFAVLDLRERRCGGSAKLMLARDRFGIKPLYYSASSGRLVFASEIKSLLLADARPEVSLSALHRYLTFLWTPGPETLFRGVVILEPGHYMLWQDGQHSIHRYWDLQFQPDPDCDLRAATEQVRETLTAAVGRHLISDVPVGVFLSGGIDSSAILALASRLNGKGVKAYTIAYRAEDGRLEQSADDPKFARLVAKQFEADYHEIVVEPNIVDLLPKAVWHLDQIVADPAAIATYLICSAARPEVKVLLSGQGGDEVFAGYRTHLAHRLAERLRLVPGFVREGPARAALRLLLAVKDHVPGVGPGLVLAAHRYLDRLLRSVPLPPAERYVFSRSYFQEEELANLYSLEVRSQVANCAAAEPYMRHFAAVEKLDFVHQMLYVDCKTFLPDLNLAYCDKLSSAASVEVRVPFLDRELIDLLVRVPSSLKLHGTTTKYILKQAMRGILPDQVIHRRKAGFGAPIRKWLRYDLREMVDDLLSPRAVRERGYFDPQRVRDLIDDDRQGVRDNTYRIWALLTFEVWLRTFIDRGEATGETAPLIAATGARP